MPTSHKKKRYNLILNLDTGDVQLFDTQFDPLETERYLVGRTRPGRQFVDGPQSMAGGQVRRCLLSEIGGVASICPTQEIIPDDTTVHLAGG